MTTLQERVEKSLAGARARMRGHGGEVAVRVLEEGVVEVEFDGACRGCPARAFTFEATVRPAIVAAAEVTDVRCAQIRLSDTARARLRAVVDRYERA